MNQDHKFDPVERGTEVYCFYCGAEDHHEDGADEDGTIFCDSCEEFHEENGECTYDNPFRCCNAASTAHCNTHKIRWCSQCDEGCPVCLADLDSEEDDLEE